MRKIQFQNGEYYHIYNRGTDKRNIFMDNKDYIRFLIGMKEFNRIDPIGSLFLLDKKQKKSKKLEAFGTLTDSVPNASNFAPIIEIISYCLNPNHFHFILKQLTDNGVSKFIAKLSQGYAMYFNEKYDRSGSLFQGRFQSVHTENYGYLLQILIYVNYNYEIHGLGESESWPWSSYLDVIGARKGTLCNLDIIKNEFGDAKNFKELASMITPEIKEKKELLKYFLE